jgi:hypothetical protein
MIVITDYYWTQNLGYEGQFAEEDYIGYQLRGDTAWGNVRVIVAIGDYPHHPIK